MLKKIGLSAAAIFAVVALAKPPAAAAGLDEYRYGDRGYQRDVRERYDYRQSLERSDYRRPEWREHGRREHEDRNRYWR